MTGDAGVRGGSSHGERRRGKCGNSAAGIPCRRGGRRGRRAALRTDERPRDAGVSGQQGARGPGARERDGREGPPGDQREPRDARERPRAGTRGVPAGPGPRERVTGWSQLFLAVIAVATLILAIVQVGVLIAAGLLARRIRRLLEQVERELQPAFAHVNSISSDAARAAAITVAQFERVDQLAAELKRRIDDAMTIVQSSLVAP